MLPIRGGKPTCETGHQSISGKIGDRKRLRNARNKRQAYATKYEHGFDAQSIHKETLNKFANWENALVQGVEILMHS